MPSQEVGILAAVQICSQFLQFFFVGSSSQNYKNGARIDENKNSYLEEDYFDTRNRAG